MLHTNMLYVMYVLYGIYILYRVGFPLLGFIYGVLSQAHHVPRCMILEAPVSQQTKGKIAK